MDKKIVRFLLTYCFGWIGSLVINHSSLKPEGYTSRTWAYFLLGFLTCGIYSQVAAICNICFDPTVENNIGYFKD